MRRSLLAYIRITLFIVTVHLGASHLSEFVEYSTRLSRLILAAQRPENSRRPLRRMAGEWWPTMNHFLQKPKQNIYLTSTQQSSVKQLVWNATGLCVVWERSRAFKIVQWRGRDLQLMCLDVVQLIFSPLVVFLGRAKWRELANCVVLVESRYETRSVRRSRRDNTAAASRGWGGGTTDALQGFAGNRWFGWHKNVIRVTDVVLLVGGHILQEFTKLISRSQPEDDVCKRETTKEKVPATRGSEPSL